MNYQVADFIIRIKNAALAKRRTILVPYSKMSKAIASILVQEHFLEEVKEEKKDGGTFLFVKIAYDRRSPVLTDVALVSKPSLRVYIKPQDIKQRERKGLNTLIISTNIGIMTGKEAFQKEVGGELLFEIW